MITSLVFAAALAGAAPATEVPEPAAVPPAAERAPRREPTFSVSVGNVTSMSFGPDTPEARQKLLESATRAAAASASCRSGLIEADAGDSRYLGAPASRTTPPVWLPGTNAEEGLYAPVMRTGADGCPVATPIFLPFAPRETSVPENTLPPPVQPLADSTMIDLRGLSPASHAPQ